MSLTYTAANFGTLAYATASLSTADNYTRIRKSSTSILALQALLAISPILPLSGGYFFGFVLLNGILQAAAGAFLQSAVVALAALFGPESLATMFTGQAVVGVAVSAVQYLSAASSTKSRSSDIEENDDLSVFALVFFGLAGAFMAFVQVSHSYLVRLPAYHAVVTPVAKRRGTIVEEEDPEEDAERDLENEPFLERSATLTRSVNLQVPGKLSIKHIAKVNAVYNFTVAWVFIITLVSLCFHFCAHT